MRLLAAVIAALAMVVGGALTPAQAGGLFKDKTYTVPTDNSEPRYITLGPDGNLWFVGSGQVFTPAADPDTGGTFHSNIGRISPRGTIDEFPIDCGGCFLDDIEAGPGGALFVTTNHSGLWRVTTAGVIDFLAPRDTDGNPVTYALGSIGRHGDDLWGGGPAVIWSYDVVNDEFTEFSVPVAVGEVAVDAGGIVWFTAPSAIGRFDPATGITTMTPVDDDVAPGGQVSSPRQLAIATDGMVWFTDRFNHSVGYLDPVSGEVNQFGTLTPSAGPQDIAAADDGSMWFAQANVGNAARITADGLITEEGRAIGDDPDSGLENALGITFRPDPDGPDGDEVASVWFTMQAANKVAALRQR